MNIIQNFWLKRNVVCTYKNFFWKRTSGSKATLTKVKSLNCFSRRWHLPILSFLIPFFKRCKRTLTWRCQICGRGFTQRGPRDAHEMIHSDRRPFLCATCGRSFRQKSNLRAHELRHRGVRRYSCDVCSRSFSLKSECSLRLACTTAFFL